jgi:hypothetical protein
MSATLIANTYAAKKIQPTANISNRTNNAPPAAARVAALAAVLLDISKSFQSIYVKPFNKILIRLITVIQLNRTSAGTGFRAPKQYSAPSATR